MVTRLIGVSITPTNQADHLNNHGVPLRLLHGVTITKHTTAIRLLIVEKGKAHLKKVERVERENLKALIERGKARTFRQIMIKPPPFCQLNRNKSHGGIQMKK
jgi:hypothetical protein